MLNVELQSAPSLVLLPVLTTYCTHHLASCLDKMNMLMEGMRQTNHHQIPLLILSTILLFLLLMRLFKNWMYLLWLCHSWPILILVHSFGHWSWTSSCWCWHLGLGKPHILLMWITAHLDESTNSCNMPQFQRF